MASFTYCRLLLLAVLVFLLGACSRPESKVLPSPLEKVRFGASSVKVHAARVGADLQGTECPGNGPEADVCEEESIDDLGVVTYGYRDGGLASVRILGSLVDYEAGQLLTAVAPGVGAGMGAPGVTISRYEAAMHAALTWEYEGLTVRTVHQVVDRMPLGGLLGTAGAGGAAVMVRTDVAGPGVALPILEGEAVTLADASEALDAFKARCDEALQMLRQLQSGTVDDALCEQLLLRQEIPLDFCRSLAEAVENGRTTREGREVLTSFISGRGYKKFNGYIVARIGEDEYEIARLRWAYYGYVPGGGNHLILKTTATGYTSKGRFSLWVRNEGTRRIETKDGFTQDWDVLVEDELGTAVKQVFDAPAGEDTAEAARRLLLAFMQGALTR